MSIPENPSIPPKPPITERTTLGSGAYGKVSTITVAGKLRAVKIGDFGPLEGRIAELRSKYLPKFISYTPTGGLTGRLITSIAPERLKKIPSEALPVAIRLCEALHDVSEKMGQPIVHRDIKEANIVLKATGEVKLIDWGCAIPTGTMPTVREGVIFQPLGTPGYMPPEAYYDENPITEKFDSWAIGITMFKLLSGGQSPLIGDDLATATIVLPMLPASKARFEKTIAELPRAPGVPEEVYTVMAGLLEIDPAKRLTPDQAGNLLKKLSKPVTVSAPGSSPMHDGTPPLPSSVSPSPTITKTPQDRVRQHGSNPKGGSPTNRPPRPKRREKAPPHEAIATPAPRSKSTLTPDTAKLPSLQSSKSAGDLGATSRRIANLAPSVLPSPSTGGGMFPKIGRNQGLL